VTSYYSNERVNPNGIVPVVPALNFSLPHDRGDLSASVPLGRAV
jgi:glutathionyl-hydroquinone reductase